MKKNELIADMVETIPRWLAFLAEEENRLQVALLEIQEEAKKERAALPDQSSASPLTWLNQTAPPPQDEPQAPTTATPGGGQVLWADKPGPELEAEVPLWELDDDQLNDQLNNGVDDSLLDGEERPW